MALIESMIIIWWFDKHSYKKAIWVTSIFLYALCLSSSMYYGIISTTSFASVNAVLSGHFPWANSFAAAFLYVAIGKYLADHQLPNIPTAKLMIIELLLIAAAIVEISLLRNTGWRITDAYLTLVPLTAVTVMIALNNQVDISDDISVLIRKASTVIYVSHGLFIYIFMNIFHIGYGAGLFFGVFFCSFALSMILIACSRKYKFFRYLM